MFTVHHIEILGCFEIQPHVMNDARGRFVKVFHKDAFAKLGLETNFVEEYYSRSSQGVIRGLHFQTPPVDHVKMVYCVHGRVMDVVLDLRVGSPTFGKYATFELSASKANCIYIAQGIAHGFCTLSEDALMVYRASTVHSVEHDSGIRWDSLHIPWPTISPVISVRDQSWPAFADFKSPFHYESYQ